MARNRSFGVSLRSSFGPFFLLTRGLVLVGKVGRLLEDLLVVGEGVDGDQGRIEVVDGVLVQVGDGEVRQDVVPRLLVELLVAGDEQRVHRRDDRVGVHQRGVVFLTVFV